MKVLLLAPELFTPDSGIPRLLRTYLRVLADLAGGSPQVSFVTLNDRAFDPTGLPGMPPAAFRSWEVCHGRKRTFVRAVLQAAPRHDLLLCGHLAQAPVAWWASCRNRRLRYVVLAHGIEAWRTLGPVQRLAARRAHRIWCVSDHTRRQLLAHNRLRSERVVVLPSGLDPSFPVVEHAGPGHRPPHILTVSRLSPHDHYKGIDHLIEAMPAVRRTVPEARLRIVGRGADRERLQTLAEQRLVLSAVEFVGHLPDDALRAALARSAVFALPSAGEGFGLVYAEALAAGTPCLAADIGGATEILTPETGHLVPYGDVPALASALLRALRQPWDREALAQRARLFSYPSFRLRVAQALSVIPSHV